MLQRQQQIGGEVHRSHHQEVAGNRATCHVRLTNANASHSPSEFIRHFILQEGQWKLQRLECL